METEKIQETEEKLIEAIKRMCENASTTSIKSDDALKYTQSALNAAHTILTLRNSTK